MRDGINPVEMIGGVPVVAASAEIDAATAEQLLARQPGQGSAG